MNNRRCWIKALHKIKMVDRLQIFLVFENHKFLSVNDFFELHEKFIVDIIEVYALNDCTELSC